MDDSLEMGAAPKRVLGAVRFLNQIQFTKCTIDFKNHVLYQLAVDSRVNHVSVQH